MLFKVARRRRHLEAERGEKAVQTSLGLVALTPHRLDTASQLHHYLPLARWVEEREGGGEGGRERERGRGGRGAWGLWSLCVFSMVYLACVVGISSGSLVLPPLNTCLACYICIIHVLIFCIIIMNVCELLRVSSS